MIKTVDDFLNNITMYRLLLYFLVILLVYSMILGSVGIISYNPLSILGSSLFLVLVSWLTNRVFSITFEAPVNLESVYITALILALIITPIKSVGDVVFLAWAGIWAMVSKYVLAIGKKHVFNPAAIAVIITAYGIDRSASWWLGNLYMTPVVVIGGILVVRKIRREDMVYTFVLTAIVTMLAFEMVKGGNILNSVNSAVFHSPLFFLAMVMLTEPLTAPTRKNLQIVYGAVVGFLFAPQIHLGGVYSTPELALAVGNLFAYVTGPKEKLILRLKEKIKISEDTYDLVFPLEKRLNYLPGQYMEWTLPHKNIDNRGNRRYFTLASSPTEDNIRIGVKFNQPSSSFKKTLLQINCDSLLAASQMAGDFVLPADKSKKLVFAAGGIGITPFRSMVKYLIDKKEKRDIVVIYSNRIADEIAYKEIFDQAEKELGLKIIYTLTDTANIPKKWTGKTGRVNEVMIKKEIADFPDRYFYLSGPHAMVNGFEIVLRNMGIKPGRIKTDFFPGYV